MLRLAAILLSAFVLLMPFSVHSEMGLGGYQGDLMRDLTVVAYIDRCLAERMPVYYNFLFYGGYLNMPSARMGVVGDMGVGYSSVPPYHSINLRFQILDRLEVSGNYRIFKGIDDPMLSHTGFGDKSDKGVNVKFAVIHPEDSHYLFPGIAVGLEDFLGTKSFDAEYIVATQVFPRLNFEASLGYGKKRIRRWFGGATWVPFRNSPYCFMRDIAFVAEYDAIPYKSKRREPHPDGRSQKSHINYGLKYRLYNLFDFSVGYVRGEKVAFSASYSYNFGLTQGLFPKFNNPLPYNAPRNTQALGPLRPDDVLVCDLLYPFRLQGFELMDVFLKQDACGNTVMRLKVFNAAWRYENEVRNRLTALLANLTPSDISKVIVVVEDDGVAVHEYHFPMEFVRMFAENAICPYEMYVLTPAREVTCPPCGSYRLFKNRMEWWFVEFYPKTCTAFGSARGKFKYALGLRLGINGWLPNDWYYSVILGYILKTDLWDVKDVDKLNPSQIINVRTDSVNYFKQRGVTLDQAYVQKNFNLTHGWFSRISAGYFEEAYGGVAGEFLYYPVCSNWAFGIEGAYLRKREYKGLGFTDKIRKLEGYHPTHVKFHGYQWFANLYCNLNQFDMDVNFKLGKFLAHDFGLRTELIRYYPSGLEVCFWYTYTDAKDKVNGRRYHDKGFGISLPLDIFLTYSSRQRWCYAISAWLRDVGAISANGQPLYYILRDSRF